MLNPFVQSAATTNHTYPQGSAMISDGTSEQKLQGMQWKIRTNEKNSAIVVDEHLRVQIEGKSAAGDHAEARAVLKDVFALGDNATLENVILPATAQTANQQALWLAKRLSKGDIEAKTFSCKDMGIVTYLGSARGLVQTPGDTISGISGRAAWLVSRGAYLTLSASWRNETLIPIYWYSVNLDTDRLKFFFTPTRDICGFLNWALGGIYRDFKA